MSDITRDDLQVVKRRSGDGWVLDYRDVTDGEFDRLARQAGYSKPSDWLKQALDSWVEHLNAPENRGDALRALLTDECPNKLKLIAPPCDTGCPICDGRGWLPKDGVAKNIPANMIEFPADWLEAEDEQ